MVAPAAIIVYEHAITLSGEIEFIWTSELTAINVLFHMNRLLGLVYAITTMFKVPYGGAYDLFYTRSFVAPITWVVTLTLLTVTWAAFSALRVYALGGRAWQPALCVLILNLLTVGMNVRLLVIDISNAIFPASYGNTLGRLLGVEGNETAGIIITGASRAGCMVADLIILGVTWRATYAIKKYADEAGMPLRITTLLLRDGTLYFVLLLILNIVDFTSYLLSISITIPYFLFAAQYVIVSRFLLNIREARQSALRTENLELSFIATHAREPLDLDAPFVAGMASLLRYDLPASAGVERSAVETFETMSRIESQSAADVAHDLGIRIQMVANTSESSNGCTAPVSYV